MINHYERAEFPKLHMANMTDIYRSTDDYSYIKGDGNVARKSKAGSKRDLAAKLFSRMLAMMLDDIIDNNALVLLPVYEGAFLAEQLPDEVFESLRQDDKLKFVNPIGSQGRFYQIIYRFKKNKNCYKYRMITDKHRFKRMVDLINKGKTYFGYVKKW